MGEIRDSTVPFTVNGLNGAVYHWLVEPYTYLVQLVSLTNC
jgi:hypothetical protein